MTRSAGGCLVAIMLLPLSVQAQTVPAPVLNLNNSTIVGRTTATRATDVRNILDYGTTAAAAAALTAACGAITGYSGEIWLPAGVYSFNSSVTACGNKNITLRGAGSNQTIISASTTAIPIVLASSSIQATIHIIGIGFNSTSASATTRAIDISYPTVAAYNEENVFIDDVTITAQLSTVTAPYPSSYTGGIKINGGWLNTINNVKYIAATQASGLPVAGTSAIELQNCYDTVITGLKATGPDAAVLQSAYSEYINLGYPDVVGANYALNVTNGPNAAKNNQAGLSYYISGGELDVVLAGANLPGITSGWITNNHIVLGRAPGGSGVALAASQNVQVQGNSIAQQGANTTATGVAITGASGGNLVANNSFTVQTDVSLGASTNSNYVMNNMDYTGLGGIPAPVYTNAGTNNFVTYPSSWAGTTTAIGGGALTAGNCTSTTLAIANSAPSMSVEASPVTYPGDGYYWRGYVSVAGTVTVKLCAAVAGTPTASAYNVRVLQ